MNISNIKELVKLVESKHLKMKDLKVIIPSKIYNLVVEYRKLEKQRKLKLINREMLRIKMQELIDDRHNKDLELDYIKDILHLQGEVATRNTKSNGNEDWTRKTRLKNSNRSVATTI